ncbi:MAG: FAD-dependent oxidoreductase [Myxococcales bacterium]|nr:FAD-dependent oxidoreductase [Myxococcales bacterium]MCB9707453.1 FAD-dependent oxidoreductase [Myxococcales bacterium]
MPLQDTDVLVAGGGLAGVAAAVTLAERGVHVTLLERQDYLGGRAAGWDDQLGDGTAFQMERGFHAFFRQYYNVRDLLRRIDPDLALLCPMDDYPLLGPGGLHQTFSGLRTHAPFNVIDMVRQVDALKIRHLLKVNVRAALEMLAFDPARTFQAFDSTSAKSYLDSLNFPRDARQMLFDVFSHSFFNPEDDMSAAEMLAMFHFYFMGNREGLIFDVMRRPFSHALWQPMEAYLAKIGVNIMKNCEICQVTPLRRAEGFNVKIRSLANGRALRAKSLVLALNVPALGAVLGESPDLGSSAWRARMASLRVTLPFAVWRLWLDRPVRHSRAEFAGTTGVGLLDNISLYHRIEDESREWAKETGGSVVELHAYAVSPAVTEEAIKSSLLKGLHTLYPETMHARIIEERWQLHQDCPAFAPGSHALRPKVTTCLSGLVLAGDYVRLDMPSALMERAVMSGMLAANHLLEQRKLPKAPIRTIAPRGMAALAFRGADAYRRMRDRPKNEARSSV